jgi:hypothetical protein
MRGEKLMTRTCSFPIRAKYVSFDWQRDSNRQLIMISILWNQFDGLMRPNLKIRWLR